MIFVKNVRFLPRSFLFQKGLALMFDDVLNSLSGLQICHSKIVEKFAFSHGERFPRFWSKT